MPNAAKYTEISRVSETLQREKPRGCHESGDAQRSKQSNTAAANDTYPPNPRKRKQRGKKDTDTRAQQQSEAGAEESNLDLARNWRILAVELPRR